MPDFLTERNMIFLDFDPFLPWILIYFWIVFHFFDYGPILDFDPFRGFWSIILDFDPNEDF